MSRSNLFFFAYLLVLCGCQDAAQTNVQEIVQESKESAKIAEGMVSRQIPSSMENRPPMVLSASYEICVDNQLPAIVTYQDGGGDFTPGQIRFGNGSNFRKIEFAIGSRFGKGLPYHELPGRFGSKFRVSSFDDTKNGVTSVKVDGFNDIENLEIVFSYSIDDELSSKYTDQAIASLRHCRVILINA